MPTAFLTVIRSTKRAIAQHGHSEYALVDHEHESEGGGGGDSAAIIGAPVKVLWFDAASMPAATTHSIDANHGTFSRQTFQDYYTGWSMARINTGSGAVQETRVASDFVSAISEGVSRFSFDSDDGKVWPGGTFAGIITNVPIYSGQVVIGSSGTMILMSSLDSDAAAALVGGVASVITGLTSGGDTPTALTISSSDGSIITVSPAVAVEGGLTIIIAARSKRTGAMAYDSASGTVRVAPAAASAIEDLPGEGTGLSTLHSAAVQLSKNIGAAGSFTLAPDGSDPTLRIVHEAGDGSIVTLAAFHRVE